MMSKQIKKVRGRLFALDKNKLLGEGEVTITRDQPLPSSIPAYEASITVPGLLLDLDRKTCLLQINSDLAGEIFLSMPSFDIGTGSPFDRGLTTFKVTLSGPEWRQSDWFQSLE